jgi:predicted RNA-binding Zn ribbon-like protein
MVDTERSIESLDLCGNALALDFVNTVHSRADRNGYEYFRRYEDLVDWPGFDGLLDDPTRSRFRQAAHADPNAAAGILDEARELRETIYRLFLVTIRGCEAAARDLEAFNLRLGQALSRQRLDATNEGFSLRWSTDSEDLGQILWPVVDAAAKLLTNGPRDRIRECKVADGGCGWLFLDTSKNGKRRWCNMQTCGNAAKVRRHRRMRMRKERRTRRKAARDTQHHHEH